MKKIKPLDKEALFKIDELFFSATDFRGVIEYGNEVFVRVSGYPRNQIIGKPHNIIRHPDMPKSVFKIFWDKLKSGSPVAAYVKNMSSEGHYYWVFALAFPLKSGYLSIRFKPTSELFQTVQDIYKETLLLEKSSEIDQSEAFLLKQLSGLGFDSYKKFMTKAIVTELNSLDSQLSSEDAIVSSEDIRTSRITSIKMSTVTALNRAFGKIEEFSECSNVFTKRMKLLEGEFKKLKVLSVNMSILANKFGKDAASLSVIAEFFSTLSNQIEKQLESFSVFTIQLVDLIDQCSLELAALKTQMNMVDFFVKESISKLETTENAFEEMNNTSDTFISLYENSSANLVNELNKLIKESLSIGGQILEIQKFINGLEIIKQTGSIESSRNDSIKLAFGISLNEMAAFTSILRSSINELSQSKSVLLSNSQEIRDSIQAISGNIKMIFDFAMRGSDKASA